ncbi:MAG: DUF4147 domain-containing protein [Candidatus Campbellbacteria bacterium]|nr:DUF4147 domain-containing protein [Candidatus Campbellbacteria bacterium]
MKIKNFEQLATTPQRTDALSILDAGLSAIDTRAVIQKTVFIEGGVLHAADGLYTLSDFDRVRVVGVGKCSVEAVRTFEEVLGDVLTDGMAIDIVPGTSQTGRVSFFVGTHPLPTQANVDATAKLLTFLDSCTSRDLVLVVISGGGSTLLSQPPQSMMVSDEARLITSLMDEGATIQEMNTVRKHLSTARGGGLAQHAHPATLVALIFSDVPGDDVSFIASGPTVLDTTTAIDARTILKKYTIEHVSEYLIETPKEKEVFEHTLNIVVVSNRVALEAMKKEAVARGYLAEIVTTTLTGEAHNIAQETLNRLHTALEKTVLLFGGETTVISEGPHGVGGRNQEVVLAGFLDIRDGETLIACASDGRDNTDIAGAIGDAVAQRRAHEQGISIEEHLASHNSFLFFEKVSSQIITGNTGSNVSDLIIALK